MAHPLWPVLAPLSLLYAGLFRLDRFWQRRQTNPTQVTPPVLVVGNLTLGGTGKSLLIPALVRQLQQRGINPGIVSRGYGRHSQELLVVTADSQAEQCGDEPLMLAQQTGVPVVVGKNRLQAIALLQQQFAVQLVICDDGLQHWRLRPDMVLLMLDGQRGVLNRQLLPWGPWRQSPRARHLHRHKLVKLQPGQQNPWPDSLAMRLADYRLLPLYDYGPKQPTPQDRLQILTSIAQPDSLLASALSIGLAIQGVSAFADHHIFTAADLAPWQQHPLLVSAKDAVKLRGLAGPRTWVLQPLLRFEPDAQWQQLIDEVVQLV